MREGFAALDFTTRLIAEEGIECAYVRCGRFRGAWTAAHYDEMAREIETQRKLLGLDADIVAPADVRAEVATDRYRGGVIFNQHGGLHPALFHTGLLERAEGAGARVIGHTAVTGIQPSNDGVDIQTGRCRIRARDVLIATNGYAPGAGGEREGVVGMPSFLIATEELGQNRVRSLIPSGRMIVETRAAHCYYRASPDGKRIVLGGRAALHPVPPEEAAARLRAYLVGLFPSLSDVAVTHAWSGNVAMTRSGHPSIGGHDHVWHAMGCNGSGVAMMPYLGWRAAQKILGTAEGGTAFDGLPYRPWPLRALYPLGMPLVSWWWRLKDRREGG
jgi:glycine/D-amino acid oxidase-like deaminating enzyme